MRRGKKKEREKIRITLKRWIHGESGWATEIHSADPHYHQKPSKPAKERNTLTHLPETKEDNKQMTKNKNNITKKKKNRNKPGK